MALLRIHSHRWQINFSLWSHLKTSRSFRGRTQTSHRTAYKQRETDAIANTKQSQHVAFKPHVPSLHFSMGHVSSLCTSQVFSIVTREGMSQLAHLNFFPVVRLHWPLHSSAPTPGPGAAKWSHRQEHISPAGSSHCGSATAPHFIYCTRLCPRPSPGSLLLPGAQPQPEDAASAMKHSWTTEHEIRQRIQTGTHPTGEHNPFIYLWVQVSQPDLQPACPFMHFLPHTY